MGALPFSRTHSAIRERWAWYWKFANKFVVGVGEVAVHLTWMMATMLLALSKSDKNQGSYKEQELKVHFQSSKSRKFVEK